MIKVTFGDMFVVFGFFLLAGWIIADAQQFRVGRTRWQSVVWCSIPLIAGFILMYGMLIA
jgi:hypothetical protein